jgi:hypothetical protein
LEEIQKFREKILQINENNFDQIALELFKFQAVHNTVYRDYLIRIGISPEQIHRLSEIPFLPIRFFKTHQVKTGSWVTKKIFRSSGTTATGYSEHHLDDVEFYTSNARGYFEKIFGLLSDSVFIAVLPSYQERDDSSLVFMAHDFIQHASTGLSGFYLNDFEKLNRVISDARNKRKSVYLLGVTFALIDLIEQGIDLSGITIIETGGMKGRRKEIIRSELHEILSKGNPAKICSEYGMTELLSQVYSIGGEWFFAAPTMKILVKEINDPFQVVSPGGAGILNIIDLANVHSCAFIETQDLGRVKENSFEVLGRVDNSDMRGCNLLLN